MRRLGKRDLARGWQAWLDEFLEKRRKKRLLAAAAGRLIKPALTAALTQWRKGWQEEQTSMLEEGQAQLRSGQEGLIKVHECELTPTLTPTQTPTPTPTPTLTLTQTLTQTLTLFLT